MNVKQIAALAFLVAIASIAAADEKGAIRAFDRARATEPELIAFLKKMPKGGDLHNHMSGAAYTDYMLDAAIAKGLFFDPATNQFTSDSTKIPARNLLSNNALLYGFLNSASMRGWTGEAQSGHDHFFATFGIFGSALDAVKMDDIFLEVIGRAKSQNLQYMELMSNIVPDYASDQYYNSIPSSVDMEAALETLKPKLAAVAQAVSPYLTSRESLGKSLGQSTLTGAEGPITIRYIYSINRLSNPDAFFASAALGIYLAANEPRVAAMNMVAPEDHPNSRNNFEGQMKMIDFLWRRLGKPNLTLHAGELTTEISPPEPMRNRIRKTIDLGHARRIGHGVSIAYEDNLDELLARMKKEGIAVEIALSSNASILGVSGDRHPLHLYRAAGVPVFLNTDDEGVSRSTMTQEWVRAVRDQKMTYADLKDMARNSIEYSFLPGNSLFEKRDYRQLSGPFKGIRNLKWTPDTAAKKLIQASPKLQVQLRLERAFVEFEAKFP